jgi:L-iditol 2-dehydrogenase
MKVGMYYNNSDVKVELQPIPEIGASDILVKTVACGICGSDVLEWYRIKKAPLVLGHEYAGVISATGTDVKNFKIGMRVFATHHVPCGECYYCKSGHETACVVFQSKNNFAPGGFSEYLKVSGKSVETGVMTLPENMSFEQATFIEPLGTVARGQRALHIKKGDCVLVLGCGIAGLLHVKLAKAKGAGVIIATDTNQYRLDAAKKFGAHSVVMAGQDPAEAVKKANNGRLADKVIICTGAKSAAEQGLQAVDKGGCVLFFAVPKPGETIAMDFNPYWRDDISIKTSYGAAPRDNKEAIELISSGLVRVDDMITHTLGIDEIAKGFKLAAEGKECLKVVIKE